LVFALMTVGLPTAAGAAPARDAVPDLAVVCDPATAGQSTSCYVRADSSTSQVLGIVRLTAAKGVATPQRCDLAPVPGPWHTTSCAFTYTPTGAGSAWRRDTVSAQYTGSNDHAAASAGARVPVAAATRPQQATSTSVTCAPDPVHLDTPLRCTVSVVAPSSAVGSTVTVGPEGENETYTCRLAGRGNPVACSVSFRYPEHVTGHTERTIIAAFPGTDRLAASTGSSSLVVLPARTPSETKLACEEDEVPTGGTTQCTVGVRDTTGALTSVVGEASITGPNGLDTSCELTGAVGGSCSFAYSPSGRGSTSRVDTLTAAFTGSSQHAPSSGTTGVAVSRRVSSTTQIACVPTPAYQGEAVECSVVVAAARRPTGQVAVSLEGDPTSSKACRLSRLDATSSTCAVKIQSSEGSLGVIERTAGAAFSGSSTVLPSRGAVEVRLLPARQASSTSITCDDRVITTGTSTRCLVVVSRADGVIDDVVGSVEVVGPRGHRSTCTLMPAPGWVSPWPACAVTYAPAGSGSNRRADALTASYAGSSTLRPSSGSTSVAVRR
jgi:hypothetical protein